MKKHSAQHKHSESFAVIFATVIMIAMWAAIMFAMFDVWATHPAEQPIDGRAYVETVQMGDVE